MQRDFWQFNAKLNDIRMNEFHWRLVHWCYWRLLAVMYCNAAVVTENRLCLVVGHHIARKHLGNVYKFCVHVH